MHSYNARDRDAIVGSVFLSQSKNKYLKTTSLRLLLQLISHKMKPKKLFLKVRNLSNKKRKLSKLLLMFPYWNKPNRLCMIN